MIRSLFVQNIFSFKEPTLVEFNVGSKAGDRHFLLKSEAAQESINSVTGIFGGNASGKTNLLKSLAFLKYFVLDSAQEKPEKQIPIESFAFVENKNEPIKIALEFEFEERLHRYDLRIKGGRVQFEALYRKDQRFRYLFERSWSDEDGYHFKSQDIGPSKSITLRENASFIASAVLQNHEFAQHISVFFEKMYVNVNLFGRLPTHDPEIENIFEVSDFYANYGDFLVSAEKHLAKADTGISRLKMKETTYLNDEGKEETFVVPFACHVVEGREYERRLIDESRGTQALYVLMRYILPVLKLGGIAIIDEFETGLHAHVVKYVVELFYSKSTNPYGAQLIANFHTDFLLNSTFEKYQIVLTEKDPETQSTDAWRLDKVKGIARNANNHYAKYHAGAYGGVPNI